MHADFPAPRRRLGADPRVLGRRRARRAARSRAATRCARFVWYPEPPCRHCGGDAPRRGRRSAAAARSSRGRWCTTPGSRSSPTGCRSSPGWSRSRRIPPCAWSRYIVDCAPDALRCDMPVRVVFRPLRYPGVARRRWCAAVRTRRAHAVAASQEAAMSELVLRGRQHRLPDHRLRRARERAARPLAGARAAAAQEPRAEGPAHRRRRRLVVRRRQEAAPARPHRHRRAQLPAVPPVRATLRRRSARAASTPRRVSTDLDADGLYAQVLYPSVTLAGARTYTDDRELQCACVRAYNEWLLEFCAPSGGRLDRRRRSSRRPASTTRSPSSSGRSSTATRARSSRPSRTARYEPTRRGRPLLGDRARRPSSRSASTSAASARAGLQPAMHAEHAQLPRRRRRLEGGRRLDPGDHQGAVLRRLRASFPRLRFVIVEGNIGWIPTRDGAGRRHVPALPLVHRRRRA